MALTRGRSRTHSRHPYDSSRSVSPTFVDSGAPSRVASTIDLPREQEYGHTYDAHHDQRSAGGDPYGRAQPHHFAEKHESMAKMVIVVGLATIIAGALQLLKSRSAARRSERRGYKDDDDRRQERRQRRRHEEQERDDHEREHNRAAPREVEQWREQINRRPIAYEPYEGSTRDGRRGDERVYNHRGDTRSRYSPQHG